MEPTINLLVQLRDKLRQRAAKQRAIAAAARNAEAYHDAIRNPAAAELAALFATSCELDAAFLEGLL